MSAKMYITLTILGDTEKTTFRELFQSVAFGYFHVAITPAFGRTTPAL